ncbi:MAG: hypothetical protein HYS13_04770 [Planctomycetia bacterium]|nr:hypothetical protein [Planctomycetia bacterium]
MTSVTQHDLEAYLDEALPAPDMARIEAALRSDAKLLESLARIHSRRDSWGHTLGEIWRRHRLTCPTREHLGAYLLKTLPAAQAKYIDFHVRTVGCRCCLASLADLRERKTEAADSTQSRRRKYFQSSAGYLRKHD